MTGREALSRNAGNIDESHHLELNHSGIKEDSVDPVAPVDNSLPPQDKVIETVQEYGSLTLGKARRSAF